MPSYNHDTKRHRHENVFLEANSTRWSNCDDHLGSWQGTQHFRDKGEPGASPAGAPEMVLKTQEPGNLFHHRNKSYVYPRRGELFPKRHSEKNKQAPEICLLSALVFKCGLFRGTFSCCLSLLISAPIFASNHPNRSATAAGAVPPPHPVSHPSPGHNVQGSPHNPSSQLPPLTAVDASTER